VSHPAAPTHAPWTVSAVAVALPTRPEALTRPPSDSSSGIGRALGPSRPLGGVWPDSGRVVSGETLETTARLDLARRKQPSGVPPVARLRTAVRTDGVPPSPASARRANRLRPGPGRASNTPTYSERITRSHTAKAPAMRPRA
jgi:hypothetical protein